MKKIISFITSIALLSTVSSVNIYAADDLETLASSLGAETEFLNIPYISESVISPDGKKEYSDQSFYITTIEVLVHNGVLNIGELQENAEKPADISDSTVLREKIKAECNKLDNYMVYQYAFKNNSAKDKIPELLSIAEKANADKEYFHIGYRGLSSEFTPDTSDDYEAYLSGHFATGIGITDGSWTFNGKQFDKCILTLDTVNTTEGKAAFSEDTCIYVNSGTYDYYIPKYSDSAKEEIHITAIGNDTMINGVTPDIYNIRCLKKNTSADYTITTHKNGIEEVRNRENDYLDYSHNSYNGNFFLKADDIKIECESHNYGVDGFTLQNKDMCVETELSAGNSVFTYDGKIYSIKGSYNSKYVSPKGSENNNYFSYKDSSNSFDLYGRILDGFSFEPDFDDFIITPDSNIALSLVIGENNMGNIFVSRKTKIHCDNETIEFYIDKDNDGKFEHKVEKGDVNCDGLIDASDASCILQEYSALSTSGSAALNKNLADYNNDGMTDASDASFVLQKYAELSTT